MSRELKGITIILLCYLFGEVVSQLIGGFMPSSVIGMLLLFGLLQRGIVKEEDIKGVCNFILNNMMMLFVPVTVGLMVSYKLIKNYWIGASATIILSTIIVLLVVGALQQYLGGRWRR